MFTLPDLPYGFDALEPYLDAETLEIHHDKHHGAYVKNTNDALSETPELLEMDPLELYTNLDKVPENVRQKVKNNLGGHINHSMFWEIMTPSADFKDLETESSLMKQIQDDFDGWENFQKAFNDEAMARFGSGWVWLTVNNGKLGVSSTANQDNPILDDKKPILGLDIWEHAYYLKYRNMRADYVKAWWNVINWEKAKENFERIGGDNT